MKDKEGEIMTPQACYEQIPTPNLRTFPCPPDQGHTNLQQVCLFVESNSKITYVTTLTNYYIVKNTFFSL